MKNFLDFVIAARKRGIPCRQRFAWDPEVKPRDGGVRQWKGRPAEKG
jgi:hypothetical protein